MNLYEMQGKFLKLYNSDIDDDELKQDTLDAIRDASSDKLIGYGHVIRNLEADRDALKAEEKQLSEKRKTIENKISRMMSAVDEAMYTFGMNEVDAGNFKFKYRKSQKVVIDDEESVPPQYAEYKVSLKRSDIKDAIKAGIEVPGARIVDNQTLGLR